MAWVEQVGARSWRVRYPDEDGGVRSVPGFPTKQVAQEYAAILEVDRRQGVWVDPVAGQITMSAWTQRWWPTVKVAERTEENYLRRLRLHILPRWGHWRLCDITVDDVNAWVRDLVVCGYARSTIRVRSSCCQ
jgi:hypothetical protein